VQAPPFWVEVVPDSISGQRAAISRSLDAGESEVLALALKLGPELILMDDRAGVEEARRLGLAVTGTLGIVARFAELGWIDLRLTLDKLGSTNFRVHPKLIRDLLEISSRKGNM
jgi:predicted nucleic acid-binding protein